MEIGLALKLSQNPCSHQVLKTQVNNHQLKYGSPNPPLMKRKFVSKMVMTHLISSLMPPPASLKNSVSPFPTAPTCNPSLLSLQKEASASDSVKVVKERALNSMPNWCNKKKIGKAINCCKKRSGQTNSNNFVDKAKQQFENSLYKDAKQQSSLLKHKMALIPGRGDTEHRQITNKVNKSHLAGCDKKLNPQIVQNAVALG